MSVGIVTAEHASRLSTQYLKQLYVRVIAAAGSVVVVVALYASTIVDSRPLQLWATVAAIATGAALLQLKLGKPDPGILLVMIALGAVPTAYWSEGGELLTIMATLALLGTAMTLLNPVSRRTRVYLGALLLSTIAVTVVHHYRLDTHGGLIDLGTVTGAAILTLGFALTYLHFAAFGRCAAYDEVLHRMLFENAADAVLIVNDSGIIERANRAATDVFGMPTLELVGVPIARLIPPGARAQHEAHVADFLRTDQRPATSEHRVVTALRAWGETFPAEISVSSFDVTGQRMAATVVHDVTDRVRAEENARAGLQAYRDLYEAVPIGLYRTTSTGLILEANGALLDIIGAHSMEEARKINVADLYVDGSQRSRFLDDATNDSAVVEFQLRRLDGETTWVRDYTTATLDVDGDMLINEGALVDIAEEVRAIEMLQAAADQKQRLIESLAHTLRTPLTAVVGFADQLVAGAVDGTNPSEPARIVADHARSLASVIDEVFLLNRLMSGSEPVEIEEVPLDRVLQKSVDALGRHSSQVRIEAPADGLPAVWVDEERLARSLTDIVGHTFRVGSTQAVVDIDGSSAEIVRIRSKHQSEAPAGEEDVFEPFAEAGPASAASDVPGFGLWSARELIRLMGGDVTHAHADGRCELVVEVRHAGEVREQVTEPTIADSTTAGVASSEIRSVTTG